MFILAHTPHIHTQGQIYYYSMVSINYYRKRENVPYFLHWYHCPYTEPTNMLDIRAVLWLEQYLKVGKGSSN